MVHIVARRHLISFFVLPLLHAGQGNACKDPIERQVWAASPVQAEAVDLARKLSANGFEIECLGRSKEEHLFDGQKGAAWVKTKQGDFEAWFLPKGRTFDDLRIAERITPEGRYLYSFRGLPHVPPNLDSSRQIIFIRDRTSFWRFGATQR